MRSELGKRVDALVFDLDGTLWNASSVSAEAWSEGAKESGLDRTFSVEDIQGVAGLSLLNCGRKLLPDVPEEKLREEVAQFSLYEKRAFEKQTGCLFPNVSEGMEILAKFYPLFIVSNCETWYLDHFLKTHAVGSLIKEGVCFATFGKEKDHNLKYLKEKYAIGHGVYLGDTAGDARASKEAGFKFCFADYGFGEAVDAEWRVSSFSEFTEQLVVV